MVPQQPSTTKVLVIGAGLGGLSAAITLATYGFQVEVFEKNDKIGGKLNIAERQGYSFDLGPSIIILPHLFRRLFERAGRTMEDYVEFTRLEPQWRSFFEDGLRLDLHGDIAAMERQLEKLGVDAAGYYAFVEYSRKLYKFVEDSYLERGADTMREIVRGHSLAKVLRELDVHASMHQTVSRYIRDPRLRDMLAFFIKYVGSSAVDAPALMNLLCYSQLGYGLFYVKGGMYNLARGLGRLLDELGVRVHTGTEVTRIQTSGRRATGIKLADGHTVAADVVVSNMEVIVAYRRLLGERGFMIKKLTRLYEPACSGLVVHIGVDRQYPELAHHNFFFSRDPQAHYDAVFRKKKLPADPTLYVVCPTRTNPELSPKGHDIIKILPHIPYVQDPPFTPQDYEALKQRVYDKIERMGLTDLRRHIVVEDVLVPEDIERMYYSNRGAIYGVVSHRYRNFALKAPKQSEKYENLFFVGGSVNPGGGTPMVVLSGQHVGHRIKELFSASHR